LLEGSSGAPFNVCHDLSAVMARMRGAYLCSEKRLYSKNIARVSLDPYLRVWSLTFFGRGALQSDLPSDDTPRQLNRLDGQIRLLTRFLIEH
jgi:hypothetical protein